MDEHYGCNCVSIIQEILHSLRSQKGKKGGIIFKIDVEKTYDNVFWKFLLGKVMFFNFNASWVCFIMSCVFNVKTSYFVEWESC